MSNQAKVGIFAFITVVIFILGFYFMKGINLFSTKTKYYAIYDRVDGLYKSNQVTVNGYKIGLVSAMSIDPKTGKITVEISSDEDFPLPKNTQARIEATDLVGGKQIALVLGDSKEILESGDTLKTTFKLGIADQLGEAVNPLVAKVSNTLNNLDEALASLKVALNKDDETSTIGRLNKSLANIEGITANLDKSLAAGGSLNHTLGNIESITGNIKKKNGQIDTLIQNLSDFSTQLKQTELKKTVDEVKSLLAQINSGQGTIGKLVKEEVIYNKLDSAVAHLDNLLVDVKARPYRYINISVFGGGAKKNAKFIKEENEAELLKNKK